MVRSAIWDKVGELLVEWESAVGGKVEAKVVVGAKYDEALREVYKAMETLKVQGKEIYDYEMYKVGIDYIGIIIYK